MTDTAKGAPSPPKAKRDRSPAFPFIPLKSAISRLVAFEEYFKRHPAPAKQSGLAWGMKGWTSQAQQTLAALKYFGLIDYNGAGENLTATVSDDGRTYLRAQQESVKLDVLKRVALKPKNIAKYFGLWGADRPPDPVCLDQLVLKGGFTEAAAKTFLSVYDATIAFANLSDSDKVPEDDAGNEEEIGADAEALEIPPQPPLPPPPNPRQGKVDLMAGERILTTGLLSKDANFRLVVTGTVGVKEIERLIQKLEIDKEILADEVGGQSDDDLVDANQRDREGNVK